MFNPQRTLSLFQPLLIVMLIIFLIVNIYDFIVSDDYDDDDTVTITFNCTHVLSNQNNFPEFVVQQCKQVRMR